MGMPSESTETTWFDDGSVQPSPAVKRAMDTYQRKLNEVQEKRDVAAKRYDTDAIFALLVCAISRELEELGLKPADVHQAAAYLESGKS